MNRAELDAIVSGGESDQVEFKRSTGKRSEGARTVCAMLNGRGGFVLFGVSDAGDVRGQDVSARTLEEVMAELRRIEPRALHYPRVSPAVIVRVTRGDRILLARGPGFAPGVFSVLAGFVEPGESLEETVAREVREEVGIEVREVRYFGSQPWPYPHSLMVAFTAEYAGGELRLQPDEIEEAGWYPVDALPTTPPSLSVAWALIDDWVRQQREGARTGRTSS